MKLRCPLCHTTFEVNNKEVDTENKYMQCPSEFCAMIFKNPLYNGDKKDD